jgi:methyltransferase-like protein
MNAMDTLAAYDHVPYHSTPHPDCHPDRLYTVGSLFGLKPAPIAAARVLELGCADGGNLLPMALNLPHSQFVGLDLSLNHIEMGRRAIRDLSCDNLTLEHAGIMDVDASWGRFDYIICRGVYSWVSAQLRDKILDIYAVNLNDHGLGYLDYNTYPGWYQLEPIRNLMKFHTAGLSDTNQAVHQAVAVADLMAGFMPDQPYMKILEKEIERIKETCKSPEGRSYIFHEYLEDENHPIYFHQLAADLASRDLEYLGEASYAHMLTHGFPDELVHIMKDLGHDVIILEQYMDFLRNRRFRQTLLCRKGLEFHRSIDPVDVPRFSFSCTQGLVFEVIEKVAGGEPAKSVLAYLHDCRPRSVPFADLYDSVRDRLMRRDPDFIQSVYTENVLAEELIRLSTINVVRFHSEQAPFASKAGLRPCLTPLARYQLDKGQTWLANQCHEPVILPPPLLELAKLLDGSRTRTDLSAFIEQGLDNGSLQIQAASDRKTMNAKGLTEADYARILDRMLARIAEKALLAA